MGLMAAREGDIKRLRQSRMPKLVAARPKPKACRESGQHALAQASVQSDVEVVEARLWDLPHAVSRRRPC